MSGQSQLEVISPQGEVQFIALDPAKGLFNIGRHPENDIVLDSAGIGLFHALLDCRQKPWQLIPLDAPDGGAAARPLQDWETVELYGYTLIPFSTGGPEAGPAAVWGAPSAAAARPAEGPANGGAARPGPAAGNGAVIPAGAAGPVASAAVATVMDRDHLDRFFKQVDSLPPNQRDEKVVAKFKPGDFAIDEEGKELDFAVDVLQTATCEATVSNGGDLVATFQVDVVGLPPGWVTIEPREINLIESGRGLVKIRFKVPRHPSSLAGGYMYSVVVTSDNYPGRMTCQGGILLVRPYYEFGLGELTPQEQTIPYLRPAGRVDLPIKNSGNSEAGYRLDIADREQACRFEIEVPGQSVRPLDHAELRVPADSTTPVPIYVRPNRRRVVGFSRRTYSYTAVVTPISGGERALSKTGAVQDAPLLGPWPIAGLVAAVLAVIVWLFWPQLDYFEVAYVVQPAASVAGTPTPPALVAAGGAAFDLAAAAITATVTATPAPLDHLTSVTINPGESVRLLWSAKPLAELRLEPDIGRVEGPDGSMVVKPERNTIYRLTARTFLSLLLPDIFRDSAEVTVNVNSLNPRLTVSWVGPFLEGTLPVTATKATIVLGESFTVQWQAEHTDELSLLINGQQVSTLELPSGSRSFTPDQTGRYGLRATNRDGNGVVGSAETGLEVVVLPPTPTPTLTPLPTPTIAPPSIERFDVQPLEIFAGEQVQISWAVIGKPTITSLPDPLLASGQRVVFPRETTTYVLQVTNAAGQTVQQEVQVIVKPVPTASPTITPSPTPAPPVVDIFQANGLEVVEVTSGDRVRLAWSVSGNVTGIEIKSLSTSEQYFPAEKQGSLLTQPLTENTQYTLVASNGTAKSNPPKQVNVIIKPPPPSVSIEAIIDATSQRLTDVNAAADVYTFDAPVGARVRVTWTNTAGTNTKRVIFDGQEYLPSASAIITIPRQSLYTLSLVAQGDNPPPLDRTGYTLEFRPQLAVPVPPANVRPVPDIPPADLLVTPPITITWDYPGDVTAIRGFAVYRADPGGPLLQVTGVLTVGQTIFVDSGTNGVNLAPPGLCGVAYSVVAVYRDIFDVDQQTPTSAASWQNPFCP